MDLVKLHVELVLRCYYQHWWNETEKGSHFCAARIIDHLDIEAAF
jgi:hypothetical protein